jgi:hypothetical protein
VALDWGMRGRKISQNVSTVAVVMWRVQGGYLAAHEARPSGRQTGHQHQHERSQIRNGGKLKTWTLKGQNG